MKISANQHFILEKDAKKHEVVSRCEVIECGER